jgi:hypothetical protein
VTPRSDPDRVAEARASAIAAGNAFRRSAVPAIAAILRARLERLVASEPAWRAAMPHEVRAAFHDATERAIGQGAAEVEARLTDDVWLDPLIAPGIRRSPGSSWDGDLPEWLVSILRALTPRKSEERLGELDDVGNRVWIALLAAAKPLDPVLEEFGLVPSEVPDLGGGNFGLAPKNAEEFDPDGSLPIAYVPHQPRANALGADRASLERDRQHDRRPRLDLALLAKAADQLL